MDQGIWRLRSQIAGAKTSGGYCCYCLRNESSGMRSYISEILPQRRLGMKLRCNSGL